MFEDFAEWCVFPLVVDVESRRKQEQRKFEESV